MKHREINKGMPVFSSQQIHHEQTAILYKTSMLIASHGWQTSNSESSERRTRIPEVPSSGVSLETVSTEVGRTLPSPFMQTQDLRLVSHNGVAEDLGLLG